VTRPLRSSLTPCFFADARSKPKNARVKRALDEREPKAVENEKTAIFVRGQNTSEKVRSAMKDLVSRSGSAADCVLQEDSSDARHAIVSRGVSRLRTPCL
jgi:hypothetical protein